MRVLGVDPGSSSGSAAIIKIGGARPVLLDAIDIPTYGKDAKLRIDGRAFVKWIVAAKPDRAYIERAQLMAEQNVSAGGKYMRAVGAIENSIDVLYIPCNTVEPGRWKKAVGLPPQATKKDSINLVVAKFEIKPVGLFRLAADHNKAEAALIAWYGCGAVFRG